MSPAGATISAKFMKDSLSVELRPNELGVCIADVAQQSYWIYTVVKSHCMYLCVVQYGNIKPASEHDAVSLL